MNAGRAATIVMVGLCALALGVLYFADLSAGSIWNTDDALYGFVVRRMVAAHSLTPPPFFDYDLAQAYPFGVRWMGIVATIFGTGLFGLRLGATLAAIATAKWMVVSWGRRAPRGWIAAGLWLVQPLVYLFSQRVMQDALLAALTMATIACWLRGERSGWLVAAGVACGLASLVKVGAGAVPLAALGLDAILFRRAWLRRGALWIGLACAIAIPAVWLAHAGMLTTMVRAMYDRLFVGLEGHGPTVAAQPHAITPGAWSTIIGQGPAAWIAIVLAIVGMVVMRRDPRTRTFMVWLVVAAVILFVTKTFLPQYALVVLLPLCALGGVGGAVLVERTRWGLSIAAAVGLALCAPLVDVDALAHHADDALLPLTRAQAAAPADALLCTVDLYHAASTFEADRVVLYLTEDERSRRILRRTFGVATVPTLSDGEIARRLDHAPHVACLMTRARYDLLAPQLHADYRVDVGEQSLALIVR